MVGCCYTGKLQQRQILTKRRLTKGRKKQRNFNVESQKLDTIKRRTLNPPLFIIYYFLYLCTSRSQIFLGYRAATKRAAPLARCSG